VVLEDLRHQEVSGERVYIVIKLPDNRIRIAEHLSSQDRGWRCGVTKGAWRLTCHSFSVYQLRGEHNLESRLERRHSLAARDLFPPVLGGSLGGEKMGQALNYVA
jgi:hypothetical protein